MSQPWDAWELHHHNPPLLSVIVGRELGCRLEGLNAAAGACRSIDTSPDVRRPFSKIIFR